MTIGHVFQVMQPYWVHIYSVVFPCFMVQPIPAIKHGVNWNPQKIYTNMSVSISSIKLKPCNGSVKLWDGKSSERIVKKLIEILN